MYICICCGVGQRSDAEDVYAWGYCHINTTTVGDENDYCTSPDWPCASGKRYNRRGPIQLTQYVSAFH